MHNFYRLAEGINVGPLALQIRHNNSLWVPLSKANLKEGQIGYSHRNVDLIILRNTPVPHDVYSSKEAEKEALDYLVAFNTDNWRTFSALMPLLYPLVELVQGVSLGRIAIVRVPPGAVIDEHFDTGLSSKYFDRYHIVVQGEEGNIFSCGQGDDREAVSMLSGEIWWFDSLKLHGVRNESTVPRISVSCDISRF